MNASAHCPLSLAEICGVQLIGWDPSGPPPALFIELPHGATRAAHFEDTRQALKGSLPTDLIHFYFVNTDVGSAECGLAIARAFTALRPDRSAVLLRSLIPRTFIDCNRVLSASAAACSA